MILTLLEKKMKKNAINLLLVLLPISVSAQNIPMHFLVKEMSEWNGSKFEIKTNTDEIGGFMYNDEEKFFVAIGTDLQEYHGTWVDTHVNYDEEYVEQKWYLSTEKKPNPKNLKTVQIIAFTRRRIDDPVDQFYWLTLVQYPEMAYGLLFYENPKYASKKSKKNK